MLHHTPCIECHTNNPLEIIWSSGEINSNLFAVCTCPNGHMTISGLMTELFDTLYKSAVDAYLKKCLSESVMSFAASLERAYELFTKIVLLKQSCTYEQIEDYWKEIKNQSERQYGAFCFCYLFATKEVWHMDSKIIEFRNKVVHKGFIATSVEVKAYAQYITNCLSKIIKIIKSDFDTERSKIYFLQKEAASSIIEKVMKEFTTAKYAASGNPSLLKWNYANYEEATFEEALETSNQLVQKHGFHL